MIPNSYRIFKLRSGEQIVCEIKSSDPKAFKVKRPMSIRSAMQFDTKGRQREFTVLRDWLGHSDEIDASIPKDFIVTIIQPNIQMAELYDREKESQDRPPMTHDIFPLSGMDEIKEIFDKDIEDIIKEELENMDEDEDADMKDPKNEMMVMSLALPVDVLKKMLDLGILDKDDFAGLSFDPNDSIPKEKISDEYTPDGDGDNWTDWSPDPLDYLKDDFENEEES